MRQHTKSCVRRVVQHSQEDQRMPGVVRKSVICQQQQLQVHDDLQGTCKNVLD